MTKDDSLEEGTVISAEQQFAGKGQRGNKWESESGRNITLSIILKPTFLALDELYVFNMSIATGLHRFISRYVADVHIKWPNDIMIGQQKVCGVLIENSVAKDHIQQSIVGIGINVNQRDFPEELNSACSLASVSNRTYDLHELEQALFMEIERAYLDLKNNGAAAIREHYLDALYRKGELHQFKTEDFSIQGRISGVSDQGKLQVSVNDKTLEFAVGEIVFQ